MRGNLGHPLLENRRAMIVAAVVGLGNGGEVVVQEAFEQEGNHRPGDDSK